MEQNEKIVVLTTTNSDVLALRLARELVSKREAACVNIISSIRSIYRWRGEICDDPELVLLIKTRRDLLDLVEQTILRISDYECPEVLALPITGGSLSYLEWLDSSLAGDAKGKSG